LTEVTDPFYSPLFKQATTSIKMSDQQAADDDFSGLGGFFFYVFIVHPCTAWILRPGRFERKKSIMYAIAFLAALAAIKTGELFILFYWYGKNLGRFIRAIIKSLEKGSNWRLE
jgi:hypothetical protein